MSDDDYAQDSHGGKVAAGVLGALGLFFVRFADECASIGARSADDVVRMSDDAAKIHAPRVGAGDDLERAGARSSQTQPLPEGGGHAAQLADEPAELEFAEIAGDLGLELVGVEIETDAPAPERVAELTSNPRFADLVDTPEAWSEFVSGFESKRAPWIFSARGNADTIDLEGHDTALVELATACWQRGTTCVFVICETACGMATANAVAEVEAGGRVSEFVERVIERRSQLRPSPLVIAITSTGRKPGLELLRKPR